MLLQVFKPLYFIFKKSRIFKKGNKSYSQHNSSSGIPVKYFMEKIGSKIASVLYIGLPCGSVVKNPPANAGDMVSVPG